MKTTVEQRCVAVIGAAIDYAEACADQEAARVGGGGPDWSECTARTQAMLSRLMTAARACSDRPTLPPQLAS
jgi:hypothetical protein